VTLRVADVAMLALDQAISDLVEGVEDQHLDLLRMLTSTEPKGLRLEQDDAGTLLAVYVVGGESVFSMPMEELLRRPLRHKLREPQTV
jgi:hypothetical protein